VKGERLRTIKLRGTTSQGLLLSKHTLDQFGTHYVNAEGAIPERWVNPSYSMVELVEGYDCTEYLGIQKWEAPIPAQLQGQAAGMFPTGLIPKTDQERCCDENTVLITEDGSKTIKEVCDTGYTGKVLSYNHETDTVEYKPIVGHSVMTRKDDQWLLIKTKTGKEMLVTKNHKVYLSTLGCYREASNLKIGDTVNILS